MPFSRSRSIESITRSVQRLVRGERAGLAEHLVDQRRLAVVDVSDDGDVADVVCVRSAAEEESSWGSSSLRAAG